MLPAYHHTAAAAAVAAAAATTAAATTAATAAAATAAATAAASGTEDGAAAVESFGQGVVVLYDFSTCQLAVTVGPGVGQDLLLPLQGASSAAKPSEAAVAAALAQYGHHNRSSSSNSGAGEGADLASVRRLGGKLRFAPGEALVLQVYLDYSLLEIFTGDGQVLSTRVYRRCSSKGAGVGSGQEGGATAGREISSSMESCGGDTVKAVPGCVWLLAGGGQVAVEGARMAAMQSIWQAGDGRGPLQSVTD